VGIGTSSPATKLNIQTTGADTEVRATTITSGNVRFGMDASGAVYNWIQSDRSSLAMQFAVDNAERMRIDSAGNLLVGTTAPDSTNSNSFTFQPVDRYSVFNHDNATGSGTAYIFFSFNGGAIGSISQSGTTGVAYNTSSDYRLKEDVQPMVGSVDRLMALKPVNFAWKVDGSRVDGFLAHEAQEVVPEAVTGSKDAVDKDGKPEYQGIDQSKIVPLLTAALQEALKRIEALEAQINS